jgi:hypothetical protein
MHTGTMCILYMCVSSYSKVGAIEKRYMVNSGVRGTKNNHLMTEMDFTYYLLGCASTVVI